MGTVKTAHKEYPLAYLKSWALGHESEKEPVRGEFCLLEAEVENGLPFYAQIRNNYLSSHSSKCFIKLNCSVKCC